MLLKKLNAKIVPQAAIGRYTVDFLLPDQSVIVEGDSQLYHSLPDHDKKKQKRDSALRSLGFLVIHCWTTDLYTKTGPAKILRHIIQRTYENTGIIYPCHRRKRSMSKSWVRFYHKLHERNPKWTDEPAD